MACGGHGSMDDGGEATEFYRVLVTGIPTQSNKELFVRERLGSLLTGDVLDVITQGTTNAIVTVRCKQGLSCTVKSQQDVDAGCTVTLYNLGTLHTTLTMGNVPGGVYQQFERLAKEHGVTFKGTKTGFTLSGLIDSIYNLRAEVDAQFLYKMQPKRSASSITEIPSATASPFGISTHPLPTKFRFAHSPVTPIFSGVKTGSIIPSHPSVVGSSSPAIGYPAISYTGPITTGGYLTTFTPSTLPSSYAPSTTTTLGHPVFSHGSTSAGHLPHFEMLSPSPSSPADDLPDPIVDYKLDDPAGHSREDGRETDPSVPGDKVKGSDAGTKSPSLPPHDAPVEERNVFTNFNPDALALVQRLSEGDIPGVEYHVKEGSVHIQLEGESKVEAAITKFQEAYKKVVAPGRRLRAENVEIPTGRSNKEVEDEISRFEQKYLFTAFVLDEEKRVVRVISQARQFDQARKFLEEALQQPPVASGWTPEPVVDLMVLQFSKNRTLTLKKGDIAKEEADILVNAANGSLLHGSGVAGALNAASEGRLQVNCNRYMETKQRGNNISVGEVAVTRGGGKLACKHVIHAVGPLGSKHSPPQCEFLVKQAISNTLKAAERYNATSIVLPAISCGIFGVSNDLVAQCIIDTILSFKYTKSAPILSDIRIVILHEPTHSCFSHYFEQKSRKAVHRSATHSHTSTLSRNEGMVLCLDDMAWIMPLLRQAAPKWKKILMKIGIQNDTIMSMRDDTKEEELLLNKGVRRWLQQKQGSPKVTLGDLATALSSPEVGEGDLASDIVKAGLHKNKGEGMRSPTSLEDVKYPFLPSTTEEESASIVNGMGTKRGGSVDTASCSKEKCPICLDDFTSPVKTKCDHTFCKECITNAMYHEPFCPICKTTLRALTGKQPAGATMTHQILDISVPGYEGSKTIKINYTIPPGVQGPEHPNPGHPYHGTSRIAYLPYTQEGWKVFKLLQKAFQARMIFTIGTSVTTGAQNVVVWNDIHHKTNITGGPQNYGYPDLNYLQRVTEDLAAKGLVPDF